MTETMIVIMTIVKTKMTKTVTIIMRVAITKKKGNIDDKNKITKQCSELKHIVCVQV